MRLDLSLSKVIFSFLEVYMFSLSKTLARRLIIGAALAALLSPAALPQQSVFAAGPAGPVAPPPGKTASKACVKKGKVGIKTPKGCIVKLGPVAPPPGM